MTYLPRNRIQTTLQDLKNGEECWTDPWSIEVASDLSMWINLSFHQCKRGGTAQLKIRRDEEGHFQAFLYDSKYRWTPSQHINSLFSICLSEFVDVCEGSL